MKQLFISLVLMTVVGLAAASAQGIEFFHGTWTEAQAKAQSENKLIFVDAYAAWCGPCKQMSARVFPDPRAGEFFNASFINMKIDMEKPENVEFARKYPVGSYPTLMFIDGGGKIVLKDVGARDVNALIELAKKALGKGDKSVDFEKGYAEGNRDPKFLLDYVAALNRAGKPSLKITNEYLNTQKDLTTPINLKFLLEGAVEADSRVFGLLVKHRDAVIAQEGKDAFDKRIELAGRKTVKKAVEFRSEELLNEAKTNVGAALPGRAESFGYEADLAYYAAVKDAKKYLKAAQAQQKNQFKNNSAQVHDLVINLLRAFPTDEKVLEQAGKWAEMAAENGGLPEYYLTLAEVCKRRGDKSKARKAAEKAAEVAGEDASGIRAKVDYFLQTLDS